MWQVSMNHQNHKSANTDGGPLHSSSFHRSWPFADKKNQHIALVCLLAKKQIMQGMIVGAKTAPCMQH